MAQCRRSFISTDVAWRQATIQWADLGHGQHRFSLLNNSKYGYNDKDNVLRLSLLRPPIWPDHEAERGHQHFTFALYPHAGDWKHALTVGHGYEYNYRLSAIQLQSHSGSLPSAHSYVAVKPENVVLTAMKKAEDENGLIFRLYEWAGKSGDVEHVPKGATGATLTNLMEKPECSALPVSNDTVTVPIRPCQILTVRVDYPHEQ
jgi:alpha-mannosidase